MTMSGRWKTFFLPKRSCFKFFPGKKKETKVRLIRSVFYIYRADIPQDIFVLFLFHASPCKLIFQCCILPVLILHSCSFPYKLLIFLITSSHASSVVYIWCEMMSVLHQQFQRSNASPIHHLKRFASTISFSSLCCSTISLFNKN